MSEQHRRHFDQLAPGWDEMSRVNDRILGEIIAVAGIEPGQSVVDLGTGTGILLPDLVRRVGDEGQVWAVDISDGMLDRARARTSAPGLEFVRADAACLPLSDEAADRIVCFSAFPHFADKPEVLGELYRVLRDGGRLVIGHDQSREAINDLHRMLGGVVGSDYLPTAAELSSMLEGAGFGAIEVDERPDRFVVSAER